MKGGILILRKIISTVALLLGLVLCILPQTSKSSNDLVYIVPVEDTVEKGLYAFLERAINTAEENGADAVILEVNTPGGAVDAAAKIGKLLSDSPIKTVAWVNNQALSAGAYISLNADEIYMVPGSTMGSAAIIDTEGNAADKKAQSYWLAAMKTAAEQYGRDPKFALAMADENIDLPELGAEKGKLLTLTAEQAEEIGYSEGTVTTKEELLKKIGLESAEVRSVEESFAEKLARFITHPVVVPILLTIGSLGLVVELYSPGFGLPGFMGLSSLLLFFYGHTVAGLAGYETLLLFALGIVLIVLELFLPGAIWGVLGVIAVIGSLFLASGNIVHMTISILIAIVVSLVVSILMVKVFGKKMKFLRRIILTDATKTEQGYVSNKNRLDLIGMEGVALTDLRPSGTVLFEEERVDVVTEGSFIKKGSKVKVLKTEGARIVVRILE
ncbi:NfeD family protein [Peribacillus alkalitolerans]|uniref:NfeD family protein n=1 Tax=Peribacillus alkalitolerans TaxID=1550385 RepID=UPI0013CFBD54|nr:nodulation protein NfeD [Peribacillus alkalitolerans]